MAEKIDTIAESRHVSGNRAIVDLSGDATLLPANRGGKRSSNSPTASGHLHCGFSRK